MRALSALLLLLVLPGLLLPAGVALRVCLCAWTTAEAPSCCAAHAQVAQPACCHHHEPAPAPDPGGERADARGDCHCLWIKAPDDRQPPAPLPAIAVHIAPPPLVGGITIAPPFVRHELHTCPAPRSRPPPPDHQRNLPLRL